MTSVEDLWAHHTKVPASYGFDRVFYGFNAFRGAGLYDNPEDALLLTNMPTDYVEAYVGWRYVPQWRDDAVGDRPPEPRRGVRCLYGHGP